MRIQLTTKQKARLEKQHEIEEDGPKSDRMKAVLLCSENWELKKIGQVLRVDETTVIGYIKEYLHEEKLYMTNEHMDTDALN